MKNKFAVTSVALSLSILAVNAQTPKQEEKIQVSEACKIAMVEINRLSEERSSFFKQNKFDEAYSSAKKAFDLTETACQEDKPKRLLAAMSVAGIQMNRRKNEEARVIFKSNLPLAEAVFGENAANFNTYLDYLIKLSVNNVGDEEFEQYVLKSVKVKRAVFGNESYEAMKELDRLAAFYDRKKLFDKSEEYYLQAIAIYDKLSPDEKAKKFRVVENYRSFLVRNFGEEGRKKDAEFMKQRTVGMFANGETSGILNGRSISLPKPRYPLSARNSRAGGTVEVSVTISETGDVIEAKAVSGNELLRPAAVDAAKGAKFLTTYVNGKAVQVTGIIVYNFVP